MLLICMLCSHSSSHNYCKIFFKFITHILFYFKLGGIVRQKTKETKSSHFWRFLFIFSICPFLMVSLPFIYLFVSKIYRMSRQNFWVLTVTFSPIGIREIEENKFKAFIRFWTCEIFLKSIHSYIYFSHTFKTTS